MEIFDSDEKKSEEIVATGLHIQWVKVTHSSHRSSLWGGEDGLTESRDEERRPHGSVGDGAGTRSGRRGNDGGVGVVWSKGRWWRRRRYRTSDVRQRGVHFLERELGNEDRRPVSLGLQHGNPTAARALPRPSMRRTQARRPWPGPSRWLPMEDMHSLCPKLEDVLAIVTETEAHSKRPCHPYAHSYTCSLGTELSWEPPHTRATTTICLLE
jgi:hypothetical protein